jgi:hypothetical protein
LSSAEARVAFARDEIELQLERVLGNSEFVKNESCARFLKFVVDETLEGRGSRLKAFTIATLALRRDAQFDPQNNSIVRVQAMRLRELLAGYYAGDGARDPIEITLPRGSYQPVFARRTALDAEAPEGAPAGPAILAASPRSAVVPWQAFLAGIAVAILVFVTGAVSPGLFRMPAGGRGENNDALTEPPGIYIDMPEPAVATPEAAGLHARLAGMIVDGLSAFDYFTVRHPGVAAAAKGDGGYVLSERYAESPDGQFYLSFRLSRQTGGELVWSRQFDGVDPDDKSAVEKVANSVVSNLGDPGSGAIFGDIRARLAKARASPSGYACLFGAVEYFGDRTAARRVSERHCLEAEVLADPENAGALNLLTYLLVSSYLDAPPEGRGMLDLLRATELAQRAYDLAPRRAASLRGIFLTRFYGKRFGEACEAARQVLAAHRDAPMLLGSLGSAHISRGSYEEGLAIAASVETSGAGAPIGSIPFFALAAHMRGDAEGAYRYASIPGAALTPMGLVMRVIACGQRRDAGCAAAAARQLRADFPGFARDLPAAFDRYAFTDAIKSTLLREMASAGFAPAAAN